MKAEKAKAPEGRIEKLRQAGKSRPSRAASDANVDAMEIPELVELRGLIDEEIARRRSELLDQLAALKAATGEAA